MKSNFFEQHKTTLNRALQEIGTRGYWSAYPEVPSGKIYGEKANEEGKTAFEALLNQDFLLDQPGSKGKTAGELSPFGFELGIKYPKSEIELLFQGINRAAVAWRNAGPEVWTGVSLEILSRLNKRSFQMAYAVMHTTGQAFMMAFQAGGPHAQDRGLEAIAYAWQELSKIPKEAYWEKPQGKNDPLKMKKEFKVVPRGVGLVIGCCTFPTWNAYPGLFADLATGNAVVVKPHPGATLPLAITVQVAREVLVEAGFDPNVVTLVAHDKEEPVGQQLAKRSEVRLIDFTGSTQNGEWLEQNAGQAHVFTEKAGVNQVILDSTPDFKGTIRNLTTSLALYSGQMCTTPQNIYLPKDGIKTSEGQISYDEVVTALVEGMNKFLSDPARAVEVLGAIQNESILARLEAVKKWKTPLLDSHSVEHPQYPQATVRTPLIIELDPSEEEKFMQEQFGPVTFVIRTENTEQSIDLARKAVSKRGALTLSVYSTEQEVINQTQEVAWETGVALSINLTGGVFVNQSAAFSDFHGTGANAAANAALTDSAFVATRFRVVQTRYAV